MKDRPRKNYRGLLIIFISIAHSSPTKLPMPNEFRILSLGDSYTIGEAVSPEERWPVQLVCRLRDAGFTTAVPTIIAQTGWTTSDLAAEIAATPPSGPFDLVTLLIGVNNQYQGRGLVEYRQQFLDLLDRAVAFAGDRADRVMVLSIPDWGVTPFAEGSDRGQIAAQIDAFNQINRAETAAAGALYVDITPITREYGQSADWLADDGLHPSRKMYAAWVGCVLDLAVKTLSR